MKKPSQTLLLGFEKAESVSHLLKQIGVFYSDFGEFASAHLLTVLRGQYDDVQIEIIEFIESLNCDLGGIRQSNSNVMSLDTLVVPIELNATVIARNESYRLRIRMVFNAKINKGGYDVTSDILIQDQIFLGNLEKMQG